MDCGGGKTFDFSKGVAPAPDLCVVCMEVPHRGILDQSLQGLVCADCAVRICVSVHHLKAAGLTLPKPGTLGLCELRPLVL